MRRHLEPFTKVFVNVTLQKYFPTQTRQVADRIVDLMVDSTKRLNVDGVDLVQNDGCGDNNFRCNDQTSIQLYVVEKLRRKLPDKIISYTFPAGQVCLTFYQYLGGFM